MGQLQTWVLQAQLLPEEEIKIQRPRSPALLPGTVAAELSFEPMELIHQRQGPISLGIAKIAAHQHHGVAITGLVGRSTHGRGVEQWRPGASGSVPEARSGPGADQRLQPWPHRPQGLTGRTGRAGEVGTEGDGQTGGGHPRAAS